MRHFIISAAGIACLAGGALAAQSGPNDARAREIFKELIEINTTDTPNGNVTKAADAVAARLKAAGFPAADVQVLGPDPRKGNLVARLRGTGARRPLLLLAHLDVVEAKREDWSFDPFTFLEKDGFFYGRGTSDDKSMAAQFVANLIRLKEEGFRPDRDLILALTADEEGGTFNGVDWLVKNHRDLIDAEFAINEGGGGTMRGGKYLTNEVQASEKVFQDFRLEVTNSGGHSSLPVKDNAIYHLVGGARAAGEVRVSGRAERGDARLLRTLRDGADRSEDGRRHARRRTPDAGPRGRGAAVGVAALLQRADADDVRRDPAAGRPREQRAAADGERERQLPHPAGRVARVGQGQARRGAGRSEDHAWRSSARPTRASRRRCVPT